MFSRFYRPPALGLPFLRKAWQRKYRSEARMILFDQPSPKGGRLAAKTRQSKTFASLKSEKRILHI